LILALAAAFPGEEGRFAIIGAWLLLGSLAMLGWLGAQAVWAILAVRMPALRRGRATLEEAAMRDRAAAKRRVVAEHAKAVSRVEKEQAKIVKGHAKKLERARRDQEKAVKRAERELQATITPSPIAQTSWPTVRLHEDRIETPDGVRALTPQLEAAVDTAGNFAVGGRSTLTRMGAGALLGGGLGLMVGAAAKKDVDKDKRELYLLVADPGWATVVKYKPDHGEKVRRLAQQINIAAANVDAARQTRRNLIAAAEARVRAARANTQAIDEATRELDGAEAEARQAVEKIRRPPTAAPEPPSSMGQSE
jgi:hypothetical protein